MADTTTTDAASLKEQDTLRQVEKTNDNKTENKTSDSNTVRTVSDIFSQLQSLFSISQSGSLIKPDYISASIIGYGPRELKCVVFKDTPVQWRVAYFGDDRIPYLMRNSFGLEKPGSAGWRDIDGFIDFKIKTFFRVLDFSRRIMIEPEKEMTSNGLRYKPSQIGIPEMLFCNSHYNISEDVRCRLDAFLTPLSNDTIDGLSYFKNINILTSPDLCGLMNSYFQLMNVTAPDIIDTFKKQYRIVSDGNNPGFYPLTIDKRIRYYPAASPTNLNEIFNRLPRGGELSYAMICNTITPDIRIVPANSITLATQMGITTTRSSIALQLSNYVFKSNMDASFYAYISYFFSPGFINLEVDFTDLNTADDMRFVIAMITKLLFQFDGAARWRNLTLRSAQDIDAIIFNMMQTEGLIDHLPNAITRSWEDFTPNRRTYAGRHWDDLRTTMSGSGWMSAGQRFYSSTDPSIYSDCARRQIFLFNWDKKITAANENSLPNPMDNCTYKAIMEILDTLSRKGGYREIKQFFQYCYTNFTRFVCSVNYYNSLNWYSGFRMTENQAGSDSSYDGIMKITTMSAESVAVLFRSLNSDSVASRRVSFPVQFQMESALMYDFIMYSVLTSYVVRMLTTELNILDEYTASEVISLCLPEPGPFTDFIKYLQQYHLSGKINTDLSWLAGDEALVTFLFRVQDIAWKLGDNLDYTSNVVLVDKLSNIRAELSRYGECAEVNAPYSLNVYHRPKLSLTTQQLLNLMKKGKVMTTIRESMAEGVAIRFPVPFINVMEYVPYNAEYPIEIQVGDVHKTIRNSINCHPLHIVTVSPSRRLLKDYPDLCSVIIPIRQNFALDYDIYSRTTFRMEEWCSEIFSIGGKIPCIQLGNLEFRSIFSPFKEGDKAEQLYVDKGEDTPLWKIFYDFFSSNVFVPIGFKN